MEMLCGRYRVGSLAGQGGFGSVYRGYDESMERDVAIKVVEGIGDREARILKSLDHKGLPRLYDIYRDRDHTYMIMEWIEGIDLERYITTRGAMSEKKAVNIGTELLKILNYLHSLRPAVIYQDLKPANIMLMPDGHIKLIDFGTALVMSYGDEAQNLAGTVGYGAPEQRGLCGVRHAGVQSDIYAWGAVMYSCISGRMLNKPPYTMDKPQAAAPGISYGMAHVISRAVSRNEKDRYQSARDVTEALRKRRYRDVVYRMGFIALMCMLTVPFILAWYMALDDGMFGAAEALIAGRHLQDAFRTGLYLRDLGLLLVTGGVMLWAFKKFRSRRFIKIDRSVYLSARRYPGLWMGALLAGAIFGAGIGGGGVPVSYAEEAVDTAGILPVSIADENGNRMLLKYDAAYSPEGDLRLVIDRDILRDKGDGCLTLAYFPEGESEAYSRSINLQIDSPMW